MSTLSWEGVGVMRAVVCKDQATAIAVQRVFPNAHIIWPCASRLRCFTAERISVMPDVDLSQVVGGMTLAKHLELRQQTFLYPTLERMSSHKAMEVYAATRAG